VIGNGHAGFGRGALEKDRHGTSPTPYLSRSPQSLAARIEREHQRAAAPVLPQAHRPQPLLPSRARRCCGGTQRQTATNARLDDTRRAARRGHRTGTILTGAHPGRQRRRNRLTETPRRPRRGPQNGLQRADQRGGRSQTRLEATIAASGVAYGLGLRDDGRFVFQAQQRGVNPQPTFTRSHPHRHTAMTIFTRPQWCIDPLSSPCEAAGTLA
jgi:hypothetical protein